MDRHYNDPFDTQVTPEEIEQFDVDVSVDEETLAEGIMPNTNKGRPLPMAIEDIIEENKDDDLSL